ncbi:MAG: 2-hydroxymuconic semialdehyde dehydrogenase [Myxococcota bacterium]|jgi:aminomuconate-semialdehyde/2-hydroxymuconate-6-semialdehyde dehydrogenase|nr:2-hydroxymuconic semialdehyde dehydrogenase [Myxococcota bacterium]MEC9440231.1 2-hydroxymuconic semialdehyde dehydrogenase [Myxococcota bacterium]
MRDLKLFIDGDFHAPSGGAWFDDFNPVNGEVCARVAEANADDVDRAVKAAKRALAGPWGSMSVAQRCALLDRVADGIDARREEFIAAEVADTGKPLSMAGTIDIPRGAANFRIFANIMRGHGSQAYPMDTSDGLGAINYVVREPLGVIGVICPWNLPLLLMTWKVAPALAAGNTVVVKPSEETPATATLLGEVMRDVGIPAGVYNVVHGFGPGSAGEALVSHPDISAITFTGETGTGKAIMRNAASDLKKVSFELGGKNPALIFADADFERAVAGTIRSTFTNCGQVCLCSERVYVQRSIFEPFVEALKKGAEALIAGDPFGEGTSIGPLISKGHREKVLSYYNLAREEGAEVITGGGVPELGAPFDQGFFVQPTIWTGLSEDARCIKEEIFGPVCHIQPFDDEDEAIAMANDTEYGLCSAVWTQDVSRAHRVARRVEAGLVWVNDWFLRDLRTPFGGVKASGIGREGGVYSLDFYSELKNICIKL